LIFVLTQGSTLERQNIRNRWIHVSNLSIFTDWRFQLSVGGFLAIILAVVTTVLFWNRTLQKQVDARTKALASEKEALR